MKLSAVFIMVFVLFLAASMAPVEQTSAAEKIPVSGTETFDPLGLLGPPVGQILEPGTVRCPGNEPTGDPMQPCPPGSRTHIRGFKFISRVESTDSKLSGDLTAVLNVNFDANTTGPVWGTFSTALDAGGTWEGTFEGRRRRVGDHWVIPLHVSGQGTGGVVDGMRFKAVDVITTSFPVPIAYTGIIEGRIINPHSN